MRAEVKQVEKRVPQVLKEQKERLKERIDTLLDTSRHLHSIGVAFLVDGKLD